MLRPGDCPLCGCACEMVIRTPGDEEPCFAKRYPIGCRVYAKCIVDEDGTPKKWRGTMMEHRPQNRGCFVYINDSGRTGGFGWSEVEAYRPSVWELLVEDENG